MASIVLSSSVLSNSASASRASSGSSSSFRANPFQPSQSSGSDSTSLSQVARSRVSSDSFNSATKVNLATDAVSRLGGALDELKTLTAKIETSVGSEREKLTAAAGELTTKINDTISKSSYLDGSSIFNSGSQKLLITVNPTVKEGDSVETSITLNQLSASALQLDDSSFDEANIAATKTKLEDAVAQNKLAASSLKSNQSQLSSFVSDQEVKETASNTATEEVDAENDADKLAKTIANEIRSSGNLDLSSTDKGVVEQLLTT